MVQFYFLSILFSILTGLILVYGRDVTTEEEDAGELSDTFADDALFSTGEDSADDTAGQKVGSLFKNVDVFNNTTFRLVLGVLSVFVGLMKLLSSCDIPVIGDLFVALACFAGGASLLVEYYVTSSSEDSSLPDFVQRVFIDSKRYIGVVCLVAGFFHFVFPRVLFL